MSSLSGKAYKNTLRTACLKHHFIGVRLKQLFFVCLFVYLFVCYLFYDFRKITKENIEHLKSKTTHSTNTTNSHFPFNHLFCHHFKNKNNISRLETFSLELLKNGLVGCLLRTCSHCSVCQILYTVVSLC